MNYSQAAFLAIALGAGYYFTRPKTSTKEKEAELAVGAEQSGKKTRAKNKKGKKGGQKDGEKTSEDNLKVSDNNNQSRIVTRSASEKEKQSESLESESQNTRSKKQKGEKKNKPKPTKEPISGKSIAENGNSKKTEAKPTKQKATKKQNVSNESLTTEKEEERVQETQNIIQTRSKDADDEWTIVGGDSAAFSKPKKSKKGITVKPTKFDSLNPEEPLEKEPTGKNMYGVLRVLPAPAESKTGQSVTKNSKKQTPKKPIEDKKRRENNRRSARVKDNKKMNDEIQENRLRQHKKELEEARLAQQIKGGRKKSTPSGATLENGRLVWD
ncbi:hypothetical protein BB559_004440 [Furculomyces boomerangus]|uniref:Uncharacterized protein n=2 Tax=Harpellales TaxID=61421 RepID=A0A2T9Y5Q5_9FUNG|nr:hypothetical protein BB559_005950 [Furculomyces boomerangus]PVU90790.1 hypothetical protein BB559_004440 [Furculomyces boomerangus]PWA03282.1 hypothetical protein BB558_000604 [Smittium angustum]